MLSFNSNARNAGGILALVGSLTIGAGCVPAISTQQEVQLGDQYAAELNRELPLVRDQAIVNYINSLGNQIAQRADPRGLRYHFYVVNAPEVNAFAVPGGHVYVNRGLIERATNMSELAGVLAHEIGHVVHRHSVEQIQRAQTANTGLAVVYGVLLGRSPSGIEQIGTQVIGSAVFAGYSRDAEREADETAIRFLVASGINPEGLVTMFEKLLAERQRNPGGVAEWFSTHPTTEERIETTRQEIARLPAGSLQNLNTNSQAYADFRSRVNGLPASASR
ncbi:MAG: M48 family metalloprotease [Gemmatimonas sp.]|nr:M48 family metalloprotease [Gemmatimonas sp.]